MERGDKHGSRTDDELAAETRGLVQGGHTGRAEEWREAEPAGDDQPDATAIPADEGVGGTPPGMDAADVAGRSELARYLSPSGFPTDRAGVLAMATGTHAPDEVVGALRALPDGRRYVNSSAVWEALGHGIERDDERF